MKYEPRTEDMFVGVYESKSKSMKGKRIRVMLASSQLHSLHVVAYQWLDDGRHDFIEVEKLLNTFTLLDDGCFVCEYCHKHSPKPLWGPGWITCPSCGEQSRTHRERQNALAADTEEWRKEAFPDTPTKENILAQLKMLLDQVPGMEPWDQKGLEVMTQGYLMALLLRVQRSMEESYKDGEVRAKAEATE